LSSHLRETGKKPNVLVATLQTACDCRADFGRICSCCSGLAAWSGSPLFIVASLQTAGRGFKRQKFLLHLLLAAWAIRPSPLLVVASFHVATLQTGLLGFQPLTSSRSALRLQRNRAEISPRAR